MEAAQMVVVEEEDMAVQDDFEMWSGKYLDACVNYWFLYHLKPEFVVAGTLSVDKDLRK